MMFLKIFALVKVVDEFDLKILANLVNILNHDDTKVRALRSKFVVIIHFEYAEPSCCLDVVVYMLNCVFC